jgi:membrane protease YdiL (CAAX protease family)
LEDLSPFKQRPKASRRPALVVMAFLALAIVFSAGLYAVRIAIPVGVGPGLFHWTEPAFDFLRMASVGIAGLVSQLWIEGSWAKLGFRRAPARYVLLAAVIPIFYGGAIYGAAWTTELAGFRGPALLALGFGSAVAQAPKHFLAALGEEIGWRGVLTPALAAMSGPRLAGVLCGLCWAAWHFGDILFFGYRSGLFLPFELSCFSVALIGLSVFMAWLRFAAASIWPCAVLHTAHNLAFYSLFERATENTAHSALWTGEFGIGFAVAGLALGAFGWRELGRLHSEPKLAQFHFGGVS